MTTKVFKGVNVFMSRNLVPPELFDSLHDALKLNGAQVLLCCDPSRNAPNDFHVISSADHEKFEDLRAKGCNLLGPQCVLSCAKEHRPLPKQGFTCCLAMDGVKLLTSGFEMDERAEIAKLVTSMGGVLQTKASMDVSFVIVKNVLAAKYKWALNVLKKPIVTINWLHQCWREHRVVPQDSFRVPPFSGLTVCVSRIPADERKQMEQLILQNGGKYSAELTRKCTHLVSDAPEGDKYKVAKRWGHIHIISRKWFDQSVARRACLNEESYPVQGSSMKTVRKMAMPSQDKSLGNSQCEASSAGTASDPQVRLYAQKAEPNSEANISHDMSSAFCDAPTFTREEDNGQSAEQLKNNSNFDGCVADDSQTEDDLYLSVCRIMLVGFHADNMRKLVSMVHRGGGSRYMSFNEKLTHIIVGTPSESEIKEVRNLAALGVIYVVKSEWLEDCDHQKKEVPVLKRHMAYDLILPRDTTNSNKRSFMAMNEMRQGSSVQPILPDDHIVKYKNSQSGVSFEKRKEVDSIRNEEMSWVNTGNLAKQQQSTEKSASHDRDNRISSNVFAGKLFCFSGSFPVDQRAEIVEWVNQGGGEVVENLVEGNTHFIVECHGVVPSETDFSASKYVSSHWIRSSLMDGHLLDVSSHILYSPLPCQVPFMSFKCFRFCVSQYDEKERLLLRNLCFILGVRFVEKLTKKVTHLLCKFASGPKYEAACKWGIQPVNSEWIYECVKQNKVVSPGPFYPKEATSQDRETGVCTMTQYPTQGIGIISGDDASQLPRHSQESKSVETEAFTKKSEEINYPIGCLKKARTFEADKTKCSFSEANLTHSICRVSPMEEDVTENASKVTTMVPDVAAAIEDLLEQTSKIHDQKSPARSACGTSLFTSDCTVLGQDRGEPQSALGLPKHWKNRFDEKDDSHNPQEDARTNDYDGFTETPTESQVVGYADDLSGRQMIIDRVRTRNSMT
ncbi:DNA topoisomerase 2-binding protein 1 [Coffea eugenioides]|uniref:DNA topoisomerase 2-binding protein 1 n=2 Tax=Coffea eugenioides TaxID=49369 RepID=UPI000F61392A|nr:DNA topoisomerase 2-binding protein 1 [Coffea eugenioides]